MQHQNYLQPATLVQSPEISRQVEAASETVQAVNYLLLQVLLKYMKAQPELFASEKLGVRIDKLLFGIVLLILQLLQ